MGGFTMKWAIIIRVERRSISLDWY